MRYVPGFRLKAPAIRHTIGDLIALYEANYRRLLTLIPELKELDPEGVSRVRDCLDLHLRVLERHKYMTLVSLTYLFPRGEQAEASPDLTIRLYHDARVAEVLACGACPGRSDGHGRPAMLQHKWVMNRFLERWLAYCLERGHCFAGAAA